MAISAAKSEIYELSSPDRENFPKGDAQSQTMDFSVRPRLCKNSRLKGKIQISSLGLSHERIHRGREPLPVHSVPRTC